MNESKYEVIHSPASQTLTKSGPETCDTFWRCPPPVDPPTIDSSATTSLARSRPGYQKEKAGDNVYIIKDYTSKIRMTGIRGNQNYRETCGHILSRT